MNLQIIMRYFFVLLLFCINCCCELVNQSDPLLVSIANGKLRGKILRDKDNQPFYAFQKIPYAEKPLGDLRFKPPQKPKPWKDILNATEMIPNCVQHGEHGISEDCLYLNVYSHRNPDLHPVMVYVYGGALVIGSANPEVHLGPQYLMTKDVVLVTFNYRLGILGFMSYEDAPMEAQGEIIANNGFKDQVMVLQWVQDNIEAFGGDPHCVTIFGNSAGAVSVHLLLLSPLTENLFHRVIIQSGTAITRGLGLNNSALLVSETLQIDTSNARKMIAQLKNITVDEILQAQNQLDIARLTINQMTPTGLVIERPSARAFMTENPWVLIQNGNFHRRPILTGTVSAEGLIYYVYRYLNNSTRYFNIEQFVPYYYHQREFAALVIDESFFPVQNYDDLPVWLDIWGHASFIFDIIRCALEHLRWGDVYFYSFEVDSKLNWSKMRVPQAANISGACHGDELGYLFYMNMLPKISKGSYDELSIDRMVTLWTNFATFGMPIVQNEPIFDHQDWFPIRRDRFHSMRIGRNLSMSEFDLEKVQFWRRLYDVFSNGEL